MKNKKEIIKLFNKKIKYLNKHNKLYFTDDNPEISYIDLSYTHNNETPHRFYISNALYEYWTATDYSKNLQIFSPNMSGWVKENMENWDHTTIIDISNTANANIRHSIGYRKIFCTDNAEILAKKYRIGFI